MQSLDPMLLNTISEVEVDFQKINELTQRDGCGRIHCA